MRFRLVDRILAWAPYQRIAGIKAVSFEEFSLKEAFGEEPKLPESILLESMLQLGNWLIVLSSDFRQMGVPVRLGRVEFQGALLPGQRMNMEVRVSRRRLDGFELAGEGTVEGRTILTGTGALAVPVPAEEFVNPDDLRVLYSEICAQAIQGAP